MHVLSGTLVKALLAFGVFPGSQFPGPGLSKFRFCAQLGEAGNGIFSY